MPGFTFESFPTVDAAITSLQLGHSTDLLSCNVGVKLDAKRQFRRRRAAIRAAPGKTDTDRGELIAAP